MRIYTECDKIARWIENNTSSDVTYFDMSYDDYCFYVIQLKITWYDVLVFFRLNKPITEDDLPF